MFDNIYVEPEIYEYFSEERTLNQPAITVLNGFYEKPVNVVTFFPRENKKHLKVLIVFPDTQGTRQTMPVYSSCLKYIV